LESKTLKYGRHFKLRGDISLKLKQIVAYADDVALLANLQKPLKKYSINCKMKQT
jgi:hypothetical protein